VFLFTRQRRYIKKADWPVGPWLTEPDSIRWTDPDTGFKCAIERHRTMGHLCGYVTVPATNKWCGKTDDDFGDEYLSVHGGITSTGAPRYGGWRFGFDCAHGGDLSQLAPLLSPDILQHMKQSGVQSLVTLANYMQHGTYRTVEYVYAEIMQLVHQLAD
jgi:hypothetical protein